MEWISRAIDKLPTWAKWIFYSLAIVVSAYGIARYGFWHFLIRAIFAP